MSPPHFTPKALSGFVMWEQFPAEDMLISVWENIICQIKAGNCHLACIIACYLPKHMKGDTAKC